MSRNRLRLHRSVEVDGKTVEYQINRRGCKGRWTKQDDEMMARLVVAAVRIEREKRSPLRRRVPAKEGR